MCLFVVGGLLGAGAGYFGAGGKTEAAAVPPAEPESEAFSVFAEDVTLMIYTAEPFMLTAQRSKPGERFAIQITHADGQAAAQCMASGALAAELEQFSTIAIKREVPAAERAAQFPRLLGRLEIRDSSVAKPPPPMIFYAAAETADADAANAGTVAVASGDFVAEVELPQAALARLAEGCTPAPAAP
jgi:hypothetical protein